MRLIDADELMIITIGEGDLSMSFVPVSFIKNAKTIEPGVKLGKWSEEYMDDALPMFRRQFVCSACKRGNTYGMSEYCPRCGAKMINNGKN